MVEGRLRSRRVLALTRVAFVIATVAFAAVGLRSQWPDVLRALADIRPCQWLLATILFSAGVLITGLVWAVVLGGYGYSLPRGEALRIFFVGQLGKYIPGSVWSFAAQAHIAAERAVPYRTTVAAGLIFVLVNLATALVLGGIALLSGTLRSSIPAPAVAVCVVAALVCLSPAVLGWTASYLAGSRWQPADPWSMTARLCGEMTVTWAAYGAGVAALLPHRKGAPLLATAGAFALAYVIGVVVVAAPAGLGIREVTMTALLASMVGLAPAAAAALLSRVLLTIIDFGAAGLAWILGRRHFAPDSG